MIDVTIIVPIHNVEQYLENCIESLINQDYDKSKMEIFLIDDYSTDNSLSIVKKYASENSFITVKELNENKGVSYARNIGIKDAKGKYLMFCDADDYYELNAVSTLMQVVNKKNADFVTANYFITSLDKSIKVNTSRYFQNDVISKENIISYMTLTSCSKIIKKDLFIQNNVFYPEEIKRCEELTVIPVLAYLALKTVSIDTALYHYCQRKTSASNTVNGNIDFFDITFNKFSQKIDKAKYYKELEFRAIDHLLYGKVLVMLKMKKSSKEIKMYIKNFKKQYPNFYKNKYLKNFNILKRIFIISLYTENLIIAKIYTHIHKMITR